MLFSTRLLGLHRPQKQIGALPFAWAGPNTRRGRRSLSALRLCAPRDCLGDGAFAGVGLVACDRGSSIGGSDAVC